MAGILSKVLQMNIEQEEQEEDEEEEEEEEAAFSLALAVATRKKKRRHRWWVHPILQNRNQHGAYHHLVQELQLHEEKFQEYFRLSREQFAMVLWHVGPYLAKHSTSREAISPRQRLAICMRLVTKWVPNPFNALC